MQLFRSTRLLSIFLFPLTVAVLLISCKKTAAPEPVPAGTTPPDLTTQTSSSVSGFVTEGNTPAAGASVQFGSATVLTDKYGYFEFSNVMVSQTAAVVTVNKTGFFKAIKTFAVVSGQAAFVRIKLLPKTIVGSISGVTGGTASITGLSVVLPAAAAVNESTGAPYTGTVTVKAAYIDPGGSDLSATMPGDLRGIATDGSMKLLTTFGMAAVELTGSAGEVLQMATGKKATLTVSIPSTHLASAPATIPLWYFNETNGLWKQEGSATKNGSNYSGEVAHFSYWNYDIPGDYVRFSCTLKNNAGLPIPYAHVKISVVGNGYGSQYGYTNASGYTSGLVPANAQLKLEVFDNTTCGNPVYSQTFTTTTVDSSLGTITLPASSRISTLTGNVKNCNNALVSNGYIIIKDGNSLVRHPLVNGTFNFNKLVCTYPIVVSLTGEDIGTMQQGQPVNYTITTSGVNNVPDLIACGVAAQQFFTYTDNGTTFSFTMPVDTLSYWNTNTITTTVSAYRKPHDPSRYVNMDYSYTWPNTTVGSTKVVSSFSSPEAGGYTLNMSGSVTITEFGAVGQFVSGNFTVTKTNPQTGILRNISGSFRVRRGPG